MATIPSPSLKLQLCGRIPFFATHNHLQTHLLSYSPGATNRSTEPEPSDSPSDPVPGSFEERLARVRYRSGQGKKAELRKARKSRKGGGGGSSSSNGSGSGVLLPPVPLKDPVSGGVKVEFGFSPYSERVNGQVAALGLSALLLVELATGKSTVRYHTPAIVFIQIYSVAAINAVYLKYEKESVSIWPESSPPKK